MSIRLSFFGDFVASKSANISVSKRVKDIIESSDIAVCNFEAPIDGDFKAFDRDGPRVKQLAQTPSLLKGWGFNVVQLANNHMLDYGDEGCTATLKAFEGIVTVGAGSYEEAYSVKTFEVKEKKIGFISCVHHEFGVWDTKDTDQKKGTAWICHHLIQKRIFEAKNDVDFLIVLPHAGIEEIDVPLPEWRELYRCFIEWGADAVVGTHPHVPQGWESYKGKPIFYSLGNFYFDFLSGQHPFWNKSLVALLEINEEGFINFDVRNVTFADNNIDEDLSDDTKSHNEYICDLLRNKYMDFVNEQSLKLWNDYNNWLTRGLGNISFKLRFVDTLKSIYVSLFKSSQKTLLENCLQCESHRWTILRIQKLIKKNRRHVKN